MVCDLAAADVFIACNLNVTKQISVQCRMEDLK
jgi:hypothetical protein